MDNHIDESDKTILEVHYDDYDYLFHCALMQDKSIFVKEIEARTRLLVSMWEKVTDRTKYKALENKAFRDQMDYWEVPYHEDIVRLDPFIGSDEDDDEDDTEETQEEIYDKMMNHLNANRDQDKTTNVVMIKGRYVERVVVNFSDDKKDG